MGVEYYLVCHKCKRMVYMGKNLPFPSETLEKVGKFYRVIQEIREEADEETLLDFTDTNRLIDFIYFAKKIMEFITDIDGFHLIYILPFYIEHREHGLEIVNDYSDKWEEVKDYLVVP